MSSGHTINFPVIPERLEHSLLLGSITSSGVLLLILLRAFDFCNARTEFLLLREIPLKNPILRLLLCGLSVIECGLRWMGHSLSKQRKRLTKGPAGTEKTHIRANPMSKHFASEYRKRQCVVTVAYACRCTDSYASFCELNK